MSFAIECDKNISDIMMNMNISFTKFDDHYVIHPEVTIAQLEELKNKMFFEKSFRTFFKTSFEEFMSKVDLILITKTGLTHSDFEDYDWMAEYESECDPRDSVNEFLLQLEEYY